ncbi:MAG: SecY-interacting protein [Pseudoalteromonas sp.]|uniref:SecY-interacting protein n=1 Tax=unclassified Pseudoalteromonas TaxID=194690 RepID=UPI003F9BF3CF
MSIVSQLKQLHQHYAEQVKARTNKLPLIEHDPEWPSPCEHGAVNEQGLIQYQAIVRQPSANLNDLANALEVVFPDALSQFYGSFFSGPIKVQLDDHHIELLQAWNEADYDLLQQNITGHILMKRKLKQAETVFIGLTEQDDLLITILLETGQVCLEYVGKKPHHVLAEDIDEFLQKLKI